MSYLYKRSFGFAIAVFILAFAAFSPQTTHAAPSSLFGWAWSSNTGWISFNSANPGGSGGTHSVVINDDGTLSGWAWSSNIGWIKFGGLSGFPTGGSTVGNAQVSGATIAGWARACSGTVKSTDPYLAQMDYPIHVPTQIGDCSTMTSRPDGWDGWIELSGTTHTLAYNSTTKAITGYAWGATGTGWFGFDLLGTNAEVNGGNASCSISTTSLPGLPGHYMIEWSSQNADYCSTVNLPGGTSGVVPSIAPPETTIYSMTCKPRTQGKLDGFCSATITVAEPPAVDVGAPAIQMWLNNDPEEVKSEIQLRVEQPVKINWKKAESLDIDRCDAYIGENFLGEDEEFNSTPRGNNNPYVIPMNLLVPGPQNFTMTCTNSDEGTIIGKTKDGLSRLEIRVVNPAIEEI